MKENWYNQIEDYHLGRLAAAQQEAFEAAMAEDAELATAVREYRTEWEIQELLAEKELRTRIQAQFATTSSPNAAPAWRKWLLGGLAIFAITAGWYFFQKTNTTPATAPAPATPGIPAPPHDATPATPQTPPPQPPVSTPDPRRYAMAAYEAPEGMSGMRSMSTDDTLGLATEAFADKNYPRVLQLLRVLPQDERQEALLLRAHAQWGAGRFAAAARDFAEVEAGGIYTKEAQWYGTLALMSTPGSAPAVWRKQLDMIRKDPTHPYQQQAGILWRKVSGK